MHINAQRMASKPETPKKDQASSSQPISPDAAYQDDTDHPSVMKSAAIPVPNSIMNSSIELQYIEISSPVPSYEAGLYSDDMLVSVPDPAKRLNVSVATSSPGYNYSDLEEKDHVLEGVPENNRSQNLQGYIMDTPYDSDDEKSGFKSESSGTVAGYALYSDDGGVGSVAGSIRRGDMYLVGDDTESNVTDDAYGQEDLTEAVLKKSAYLVDDAKGNPAYGSSEMNFSSAYVGLRISDPLAALELPVGTEDDENDLESNEEDHLRTGLLRLSRSSSSGSLGYSGFRRYSSSSLNASDGMYAAGSQSLRSTSASLNNSYVPEASSSSNPSSDASSSAPDTYFTQSSPAASPRTDASSSSGAPSSSSHSSVEYSDGSYTSEAGPPPASSSSSSSSRNLKGSAGSSIRSVRSSASLITPQAIQETLDSKGSWNDRFQAIYDAPDSEAKYDALHRLSMDFLGVAETYGKVIIAELSLPDNEKSIKPINIGGVAGGSKYAVRGLLFKFAVDVPPHYLYGSDEYAQKAAGHELKGLNQWSLNSEGLHFPLMALVRYCGFTLVALSMLPVGNGSLVYGSDDAGRSVHFDDDELYEKMKKTALALNLKGHYLVADTSKLIYGPGDIEGHYGEDHLHYVLDFARVYPPAALVQGEVKEKSRCLFRLLRPELVSRFTKPLSSDAFTAWGRMNSDVHNAEVRLATQYLVDEVIPALAAQVVSLRVFDDLTRMFHLNGVNIRYMGLVRRVVYASYPQNSDSDTHAHAWLLREMVARTIKSILSQKWRELIKKYQRITPDRCIQEAIGLLNACVEPQSTPGSITFWGKTIRDLLNVKFPLALIDTENELDENGVGKVDLQRLVFGDGQHTTWRFMFKRISELTGMRFGDPMSNMNAAFPYFGVLTPGDVIEIHSSVKQMSLVDFAYVMSKSLNGLRQLSSALASRLFGLAIARLRDAPEISLLVLRRIIALKTYIVRTLKRMKWVTSMIDAVGELVDVALDGAQLMCNNLPSDLATDAAVFLHEIHANKNDGNKIIQYLERAMATDPTNVRPYIEITKIHAYNARPRLTPVVRKWIDTTVCVAPTDALMRLQIGLLILTLPNAFADAVETESMPSSGLRAWEEVVEHWTVVKQTDPNLFYQVDLHHFAARDTPTSPRVITAIDHAAGQRGRSFSALVHVAVHLQCPELVDAIKESLHMDFSSLLFHSTATTPWTSESLALLASCGPFPHFKKVHLPDLGADMGPCCERELGNLLARCAELEELNISANLKMSGELLASISQPHKLVTLDVPGLELEDAHLEAFCDAMLASKAAAIPETATPLDRASEVLEAAHGAEYCALRHLLLPSTITADTMVRVLHKLGEKAPLEALRFSHYNESIPEALARHADTLKLVSVADCNQITDVVVQNIISVLPNLLVFDAVGSSLGDGEFARMASKTNIHPSMEFVITAGGTYFMFSAGQKRTLRLAASHAKPVQFSLGLTAHEWPGLGLMKYARSREYFDMARNAAPVIFFQCEKSLNSHAPQTFTIFGKARNSHHVKSTASALGHSSQIMWSLGGFRIAEVKIPNNLAGASQLQWVQDSNLKGIIPTSSIAHIMRVNLCIPGLPDQHLIFQSQGGSNPFSVPPGFSINFFAVGLLSYLRLLPV